MKKKSIKIIFILIFKVTNHTSASTVSSSTNNYTINQMIKEWKGESRKDFDEYFAGHSNDQRILAGDDNERGVYSYQPGVSPNQMKKLPNNKYQLPDGTIGEFIPELESSKATTVNEMKNVVYQYLKN